MIKPASDGGVTSHGISPIRGSSKRQMTPLKVIRKTSRKDQGAGNFSTVFHAFLNEYEVLMLL